MNLLVITSWVHAHAYSAGVLAVLGCVLAAVLRAVRHATVRPPAAVVVSAIGAAMCTAYSGDTSWRFAADRLGMHSAHERAIMFAAAEFALFSVALMARQNLRTTGAPGTPGALVWVITGVQIIPAYSESGAVGGTVRAFVGPVLAAVLWHQAMGIELRHHKPGAASQSLPAILLRELRERLLSYLGLSVRGRDAAQIARDRWTRIATHRAARLAVLQAATGSSTRRISRATRRLAAAVDRTDAGVLPQQQAVLLDRIAAYRGAGSLASMALTAPWEREAEPAPVEAVIERVPETGPQAEYPYPQLLRPVLPVVPTGVRLLPLTSARKSQPAAAVPAAEASRTRAGVRAEYVPETEHEAEDDSPPPPAEDTLTARARGDFLTELVAGDVPSIRVLRARYSIGSDRATRIQTELKRYLP